ncbi:thioredoxin domain-containing protein [Candidatus Woesebacteria bacterium]|nr:thioredoxin domain-containing protein [Candidatus Woesebacteria bacterium]
MKNVPLLIGTLVVTLMMIIGVAVIFSNPSDSQTAQDVVPVAEGTLVPEGANVKGATESAVTIVEFSDFQCPACKATQPLVDGVMAQYGEDVTLVFRNYPLISIHRNAQAAAVFAEAAAEQDAFWEVHDKLFEMQSEWEGITSADELRATFVRYAQELGLDTAKLEEDMENSAVVARVQRDISDGNAANINATPTFYVNGVRTPAPQLLSAVEELVVDNDL